MILCCGASARGGETVVWNGFAFGRITAAPDAGPLTAENAESQLHLGLDWNPGGALSGHVAMLARTADDESRRGQAGIVEAYLETNIRRANHRLRLRGGAMFLPTSRENVDALWETAYSVQPSALNSWFGEEFRPIGLDATWTHGGLFAGATVFRGNDTFGALPPVRGWRLQDHWALLGEHIPVDDEYYTSVSAETDKRLGWSARAGWIGERLLLQGTHIDNRSDALEHGELANWDTRFDVIAADFSTGDWNVIAEHGRGPTIVISDFGTFRSDLRASYLLVSRRFDRLRATLRAEEFGSEQSKQHALTGALLWNVRPELRVGVEASACEGDHRVLLDVRRYFSGNR